MSNEADNPRAVMGANMPPETDPLIVEANERIDTGNRYLTERSDVSKWDKEIADKANAFIEQITGTYDALDKQRLQEGRDFKAKQEAKYKAPLSLLEAAKTKLTALRTKYLQNEEDKLKAERKKAEEAAAEAKRLADEAARRAEEEAKKKGGDPLRAELAAEEARKKAEALQEEAEAAPQKAQIKGTFSSRAKGLSDYWSAEVTDASLAARHYVKKGSFYKAEFDAGLKELVQKIANKDAVRQKVEPGEVPGIKFKKERR